jgi:hypothetical protein
MLDGLEDQRVANDRLGEGREAGSAGTDSSPPGAVVPFVLFFVLDQPSQSQLAKRLRCRRMP